MVNVVTTLTQQLQKKDKELFTLKTKEEIEKMRKAGNIAAQILDILNDYIKPGITTRQLDKIVYDLIVNKFKAKPDRIDLNGVPISKQVISISHNSILANGEVNDIPLKAGDILGIDISLKKDSYCGDTQKMYIVGGNTSLLAWKLLTVAYQAMWLGIKLIKPGIHLGTISHAVEQLVKAQGFNIAKYPGLSAHSIGKLHFEGLLLPFYGEQPETGHTLQEGMVITIEPFITAGTGEINIIPNSDFCTITKDGSLGAMFEHVVAVTANGYDILDLRPGESDNNVPLNI